jgi:predicted small lipoprotein YifL
MNGFRLLVFLTVVAMLAGCGKSYPDYYPVTGKVYYRDQPLTTGVVMFQPPSGPPATGQIQSDGSFTLVTHGRADGAMPGLNQVRITAREMKADAAEMALGKHLIPERYSQFSTSGLTAEVSAGDNEPFEFRLTD